MPFYAVRAGHHPAVYTSWGACEQQLKGYRRPDYGQFNTLEEAYQYLYADYDTYVDGYVKDVYTDGACLNNGQPGAAAGIGVFWGDDDDRNVSERYVGRQTNNSAEINAAIRAIDQADWYKLPAINLITDSMFLIDAVKKGWIDDWKKNGWRTFPGYTIKNKEDFQELDRLLCNTHVTINWIHVRARSGVYGNERADKMAKDGCKMSATTGPLA